MNKKGFIIGLVIVFIVLLIIIPIIIFNTKDLVLEKKLYDEIDSIIDLIDEDNINMDKINEKTNTYITKDNFLLVEMASKNYLNDLSITFNDAYNILEDKKVTKLLSIDNYKNDGKEFNNTLSYISELKTKIKTVKSNLNDLSNNNKIMEYINKYNLDSYYTDLYKKLVINEDLEFDDDINEFDKLVTDIENLILFLRNNKDKWEIQDDKIAFKSNELIDKYNELLDKID